MVKLNMVHRAHIHALNFRRNTSTRSWFMDLVKKRTTAISPCLSELRRAMWGEYHRALVLAETTRLNLVAYEDEHIFWSIFVWRHPQTQRQEVWRSTKRQSSEKRRYRSWIRRLFQPFQAKAFCKSGSSRVHRRIARLWTTCVGVSVLRLHKVVDWRWIQNILTLHHWLCGLEHLSRAFFLVKVNLLMKWLLRVTRKETWQHVQERRCSPCSVSMASMSCLTGGPPAVSDVSVSYELAIFID
jgi:hypothetical protein